MVSGRGSRLLKRQRHKQPGQSVTAAPGIIYVLPTLEATPAS